jgi:hypothetical protein
MKTLIYIYLTLIILIGPSCKADNEKPAAENGTGTIKIYKNDQMVAEYTDNDVVAIKDEDMMIVYILSDDDDHTLSISLVNPKKGEFPIDYNYEANGARVHLISTALVSNEGDLSFIIFPEGTVSIEEYSATSVKGKIEANGLPGIGIGVVFSITGTFTAVVTEI